MNAFNFFKPAWLRLLGLMALLLCLSGFFIDRSSFFSAWLIAWWFCISIALGSLANLCLHRLSGGTWGEVIQEPLYLAIRCLPILAVLMVPLLWAGDSIYPWASHNLQWLEDIDHPAFKQEWFDPNFFMVRCVLYVLVWSLLGYGLQRPSLMYKKGFAALCLIIYTHSASFAAIDFIMSLMPQWYSTGFGLLVLIAQMKMSMAWATVFFAWRSLAANPSQSSILKTKVSRDLGNLLLMYVMTWAYLAFTQFQIIWAENLPEEINWYVPRLQTHWVILGYGLIIFNFFIPFFLLLFRRVKDHHVFLKWLAIELIVMGLLDTVWLTLPSIPNIKLHVLWMLPLALIGMLSLSWGLINTKCVSSVNDPKGQV